MNTNSRRDYDNWHRQITEMERMPDHNLHAPWHQLLFDHLIDVANLSVLEVACGRGSLSFELCRRGGRVVAADFSATAVRIARRLIVDKSPLVGLCQADAMHLPFASASFDVLISCETLEHLPDPKAAIAEFLRVVRPGAYVYVTIPSYLNVTGLVRLYLKARKRSFNSGILTQPIENWTFVSGVAREFHRRGGRVQIIDGVGHYFPLPRRNPVDCRIQSLDVMVLRPLLKYLALHTLLVIRR